MVLLSSVLGYRTGIFDSPFHFPQLLCCDSDCTTSCLVAGRRGLTRGRSQYGLLHFAQLIGLAWLRGHQEYPQRRHDSLFKCSLWFMLDLQSGVYTTIMEMSIGVAVFSRFSPPLLLCSASVSPSGLQALATPRRRHTDSSLPVSRASPPASRGARCPSVRPPSARPCCG